MDDQLPNLVTVTRTEKCPLYNRQGLVEENAVLDSTVGDGSTNANSDLSAPAWQVPAGLVVCQDESGSKWVEANDKDRKGGAMAAITSAEDVDAGWASGTLKLYIDGQLVASVPAAGTDDTAAEYVTLLNANASFAANAFASASGSALVITALRGHSMRVHHTLDTAYDDAGAGGGSEESAAATVARYGVTLHPCVLQDLNGNAIDGPTKIATKGVFKESELTSLTGEAKGALIAQGAIFK